MRLEPRTTLPLLLLLSFVLNLVPLWWGLPAYPTWAPDELTPDSALEEERWPAKYPPFHRYLLSSLYKPVDLLVSEGTAPDAWLHRVGRLQAIGRLLSVVMGVAVVYLVYRFGLLLFDRPAALLGAAIVALSPSFVYYSKTVNLEIPYLFWFSLSLLFLFSAARSGRLRNYLLFGVAAALAVGTKDQAYGLYLAAPLVLAWGQPQRGELGNGGSVVWRAVADRRIWAAVAAGAAIMALVYRLPFGWDDLARHFRTVTGDRTMVYQTYERSVIGHGRMLVRAAANFGFAIGLPWLLSAVAGFWLALRDDGKRWFGVGVVLLGLGYYVGFVSIIGYHYVRFFLPLLVLAAPLAAWGLLRSFEALGWRRATPALVTVLLLVSFGRAVAVDVAMLGDSRYRAEAFLAQEMTGPVQGLGRKNMLPRRLAVGPWGRLEMEGCAFFAPELEALVVNATDLRDDRERELFTRLRDGDFGFDRVQRLPERPGIRGLRLQTVDSNLSFLNPDLWIFTRGQRRCLSRDTLPEFLMEMKSEGGVERRRILAAAIRAERLPVRIVGDTLPAPAVNLRYDGWSYGEQPIAVLIDNTGESPLVPQFQIGCWASPRDYPLTASIDDGRSLQTVQFERSGQQYAALNPVAPGESVLVLVWSDKAWQRQGSPPRPLGVNLRRVRFFQVPGGRDAS